MLSLQLSQIHPPAGSSLPGGCVPPSSTFLRLSRFVLGAAVVVSVASRAQGSRRHARLPLHQHRGPASTVAVANVLAAPVEHEQLAGAVSQAGSLTVRRGVALAGAFNLRRGIGAVVHELRPDAEWGVDFQKLGGQSARQQDGGSSYRSGRLGGGDSSLLRLCQFVHSEAVVFLTSVTSVVDAESVRGSPVFDFGGVRLVWAPAYRLEPLRAPDLGHNELNDQYNEAGANAGAKQHEDSAEGLQLHACGVSMNMAHWPVLTWLRASSVVLKNPQPDIRRNISVYCSSIGHDIKYPDSIMDPLPKSTGLQMDNGQLSFNCDKFNKIKDKNELHDALDPEVSGSPQVNSLQPEGPGTPEAPVSPQDPGHLKRPCLFRWTRYSLKDPGHLKRSCLFRWTRYSLKDPGHLKRPSPFRWICYSVKDPRHLKRPSPFRWTRYSLKDPGHLKRSCLFRWTRYSLKDPGHLKRSCLFRWTRYSLKDPGHLKRPCLFWWTRYSLKDPGHLKRSCLFRWTRYSLKDPGHLKRLLGQATDESDEESDGDIPDIQADEIPDSSNSVEAQPELNQTEDAVDSLLAAVVGGNFLDVQRWLSHPASEGFEQLGAALEQAVQMDWVPVVYQLLELGAAEATGDAEFQSRLLTEAIRLGHLAAAEALIRGPGRRGGGCCQLGETSLILAVQPGASLQFVKAFADDGEDVNATDLHGRTALSYAAQHGLCDIVRWLCTCARASRNIADTMEWTPINYAMWALEHLPEDRDADRRNLSEVIDILDDSVDK
uniref:ANK_REP_REGION domain-containing protein n=1 Tax=Macrostomum lignano TaxID=282301 RepID=A0A1I8H6C7_9PLAT